MASRIEELLQAILNGDRVSIVPQSRNEQLLMAIANGEVLDITPKSNTEMLLVALAEAVADSGESGGDDTGSGDTGGDGIVSYDSLTIATGYVKPGNDGRITVEHGLGVMPDLVFFQLATFIDYGAFESIEAGVRSAVLTSAWGMKSAIDNTNKSGLTSNATGWLSEYGLDNMPGSDQSAGYIYCPDADTFMVGGTGGTFGVHTENGYRWIAFAGIGSASSSGGSGGSSADVRYVTFMSEDGSVEYGKKAVAVGDDCADPIARGVFSTPTKESDEQYNYTHYGWALTAGGATDSAALKAVNEDRTVYATFASTVRLYTISFYDDDGTTLLATKSVAYGSVPSYTPTRDSYDFAGWEPEPLAVTGPASYTATWTAKAEFSTATWAKIAEICDAGKAKEYFAVGDTRTETIVYEDGTTENVTFEIGDMNLTADKMYPLNSSDYTKASIVLMATHVLSEPKNYDETEADMSSYSMSFTSSDLLTYLQNLANYIPEDMAAALKEIKSYWGGNSSKLFIPSTEQILGKKFDHMNAAGTAKADARFEIFNNGRTAICKDSSGNAVEYWTSSCEQASSSVTGYRPIYINTSGSMKVSTYLKTEKYVRLMCFV